MSEFPDFTTYGYVVKQALGHNRSGGRATYLAVEHETQNNVVLKQFQFTQAGCTWADYQYYEQEVKLLQRLTHPSIPRYLGCFETPTGFCLVQEYKQAPSLAQRQLWTLVEIRQIAEGLLKVLIYLQQQQPPIIHRDVKPENVLVERQNMIRVYLVDFGFARLGDGEVSVSSMVKGTMGFMPPEQLLNRELTNASDLYGVGMTLICLLTGMRSVDIGQLVNESYQVDFKKLPSRCRPLVNWLTKMTAPKVSDRYPNARAALYALSQVDLTQNPKQIGQFPQRKLQPVYLGLALAGIVAISAFTWWNPTKPKPTVSEQAMYYELISQGNGLLNKGQFGDAADLYEQAIQLNPKRKEAWYCKGMALLEQQRLEAALVYFQSASQPNMETDGLFPEYLLWRAKALTLGALGHKQEALAAYDQALQINPNLPSAQQERQMILDGPVHSR